MKYALEVLKKERDMISKALVGWKTDEYPEAKRRQQSKLDDLQKAIDLIQVKTTQKTLF